MGGCSLCTRWLAKYVLDVRPQLVVEPDEQWLFLTDYGEPLDFLDAKQLAKVLETL